MRHTVLSETKAKLIDLMKCDGVHSELSFCHCPYRVAAEATELPCRMEEHLLEDAMDKKLIRERHIASGDSVCEYRLVEPSEVE